MTIVGWVGFFFWVSLAFYLLATAPLDEAYDRKRERDYDEESEWELDYHARWNPSDENEDVEPWGARR